MKRRLVSVTGLVLMTLCGLAFAQQVADLVEVKDPYVRAVPPGQPNSASFMALSNTDAQGHALVAAESPVSKVVELHTHTMEDGMMRMRQVEKIELPAGEPVALQPGGLHVMLIGLQQELVPGAEIPITLVFEDGSKLSIKAPVRKLQMHMKHMDHSGHKDHMKH
ncbi:MAG: copper chaperone PCu(A)C [Gammaproteobacteria bacterium]|nr:copper chaperone PCu(A)C [Gammaproteobacteria bacterium]